MAPHAQFTIADEGTFLRIPDEVSDRDASWFAIAHITQNGIRTVAPHLGEDIVVLGLGPLGQLVVQYSRLMGARKIIAIDTASDRVRMAESHGATIGLAIPAGDAMAAVSDHTDGRMADTVYDMTGNAQVFVAAQQMLRVKGTLALIGDSGFPAHQHLSSAVLLKSLRIVASHANNTPPKETPWTHWTRDNMVRLFFDYVKDGRLLISDLNTHTFLPSEPKAAFDRLLEDRGSTLGTQFDWRLI
jgi:threonine dehydrogenase-like Zn-dependent dehydrogenase